MVRKLLLALAVVIAWDFANIPPLRDLTVGAQVVCNEPVAATATGLGNATVTATIAGVANRMVYLHTVDVQMVANAAVTGAAGPAPTITSSALAGGVTLVWWGDNSALIIGQQRQVVSALFPPFTVRAQSLGASLTITSTGGQATQNVRINLTGCYGG